MSFYKPIELLLTNATYDTVIALNGLAPELRAQMSADNMAENVARNMLHAIGNWASPAVVFAALAAIGGPRTAEDIHARVCAIKEAAATAAPAGGAQQ